MLINVYTVSYLLISLCVLAFCFPLMLVSKKVVAMWQEERSSERQYSIEKKAYLVITIMMLMLLVKTTMVPFWFITLASLIPSIPGAGCLAGVHMFRYPYSFYLSAFKVFTPLLYIFWLFVNALDRRIAQMPFVKLKFKMAAGIAFITLIESVCDIVMLFSIKPRRVSCCSSLFDLPSENVPEVLTSTNYTWLVAFLVICFISFAFEAIFYKRQHLFRIFKNLIWLGIAGGISYILALHTIISPVVLHSMHHHCVFCVIERNGVMLAASLLLISGFWLASIAGTIYRCCYGLQKSYDIQTKSMISKITRISCVFLLGGLVLFAQQFLYHKAHQMHAVWHHDHDDHKHDDHNLKEHEHHDVNKDAIANVTHCEFCSREIAKDNNSYFCAYDTSGNAHVTCCAYCGLLMFFKDPQVYTDALCMDYETMELVDLEQCYFLIGSRLHVCCVPSVLPFKNEKYAGEVQTKYGGEIVRFSLDNKDKIMGLFRKYQSD